MDQVRHLILVVDFSVITLDTHWDPKGQRIYNRKVEAKEQSKSVVEEQPEPVAEEQLVEEAVAGEVRCGAAEFGASVFLVSLWVGYVPGSRNMSAFYGAELVGALSKDFDYPVGAFPICS
ncbi:hypothetical protein PIB30_036210 [Stylosanthes scabra]|uniref:Uncharacterized protein n=1 Tax=Stylosanthes scabra TaxID=79078 RepID=A0ABU6TD22_9FABA|nr:hypothetical protein [Stylosanthes scabra]